LIVVIVKKKSFYIRYDLQYEHHLLKESNELLILRLDRLLINLVYHDQPSESKTIGDEHLKHILINLS